MKTTEAMGRVTPRLKRARAIVRSWDGPNSRLGCEVDPMEMPWAPFESLGKEVTLLLPTPAAGNHDADTGEPQADWALRFVEHAVDRCAEFSTLQNGADPSWRRSQETWEWIRDRLTSLWVGKAMGEEPVPEREVRRSPEEERLAGLSMPGAARMLEVAAVALRAMPLGAWRDAVATLDPDMPTREETIQTLKGVARLLSGTSHPEPGARETPPPAMERTSPAPEPEEELQEDELSIDYARGFDEGYQMGRRVGRALAVHERQKASRGTGPSRP